jgi:hypothetical protein
MAIAKISAELKSIPRSRRRKSCRPPSRRSQGQRLRSPTPENQAALQKAQAELAAVAAKYEPLRIAYKARQDESAKHKADLASAADVGVKWTLESPHQSALILAGNALRGWQGRGDRHRHRNGQTDLANGCGW